MRSLTTHKLTFYTTTLCRYEVEKLGQSCKEACRAAVAAGVPQRDAEEEAKQQLKDDVRKLQDRMSNEEFMLTLTVGTPAGSG